MKKRGFTDKLYFLNLCLTWVFITVCVILTILGLYMGYTDLPIISVGIPAAFAELGLHTAFVVHKAKVENLAKFGGKIENATINID